MGKPITQEKVDGLLDKAAAKAQKSEGKAVKLETKRVLSLIAAAKTENRDTADKVERRITNLVLTSLTQQIKSTPASTGAEAA